MSGQSGHLPKILIFQLNVKHVSMPRKNFLFLYRKNLWVTSASFLIGEFTVQTAALVFMTDNT